MDWFIMMFFLLFILTALAYKRDTQICRDYVKNFTMNFNVSQVFTTSVVDQLPYYNFTLKKSGDNEP